MNIDRHGFARQPLELVPGPFQLFSDLRVNRKVPTLDGRLRSRPGGQHGELLGFILAGRNAFSTRSIGIPCTPFETTSDKLCSHKGTSLKKTGTVSVRENRHHSGASSHFRSAIVDPN